MIRELDLTRATQTAETGAWKSLAEIKPLEIRGHHLKRLRQTLAFYQTTGSVEGAVDSVVSCAQVSIELARRPGYKADVLGHLENQQELYWGAYRELLISFLNLPDDHLVKIIKDGKDDFCKICVVGNHCLDRGPWGISTDSMVIWDMLGKDYMGKLSNDGEINVDLGKLKEVLVGR